MSQYTPNPDPDNEAEPIPSVVRARETRSRANGKRKPVESAQPIPGVNVRELMAERNYSALAGLGLLVLGLLLVVQNMLGLSFSLWSLLLLGTGGWIMRDAWRDYDQRGRSWTDTIRNRMLAGGLVMLFAIMGMMSINWWGLFLMGAGGWLGYDTYQKYEANGRVLSEPLRNRGLVAALIGSIGVFGFFGLGSAWPLILIVIGVAMLYRRYSR